MFRYPGLIVLSITNIILILANTVDDKCKKGHNNITNFKKKPGIPYPGFVARTEITSSPTGELMIPCWGALLRKVCF